MAVIAICIDIITVTADSFMSCVFVCQEDLIAFYLPSYIQIIVFNLLNAELNPICHLLALLGAHHILHISRIRVKTQLCTALACVEAM